MIINIFISIIIQLIFVFINYFDVSYGCIVIPDIKQKELKSKTPKNYISLYETIQNIRETKNIAQEYYLLIKFSDYLRMKKNLNMDINQLEFLWMSLKEFAWDLNNQDDFQRNNYFKSALPSLSSNENNLDQDQKFYYTIDDVEKMLEELKMGNAKINIKGVKNRNITTNRSELLQWRHTLIRNQKLCSTQKHIFCIPKYMKIINMTKPSTFSPFGIKYHRCIKQCTCFEPYTCLPVQTNNIESYIVLKDKFSSSIRVIDIINHTKCECRNKCLNRRCIYPFNINQTDPITCECVCKPGKERMCNEILNGERGFNNTDYSCLVTGKCLYPKCRAGELSEEYLYANRCPPTSSIFNDPN